MQQLLTNLGWGQTLFAQFKNIVFDFIRGYLQPSGNTTSVGERRLGDTLTEIQENIIGTDHAVT